MEGEVGPKKRRRDRGNHLAGMIATGLEVENPCMSCGWWALLGEEG